MYFRYVINALIYILNKMTSSNGNIFRVTGPLLGESTGHRWIPITKASDAELWCFSWSVLEQTLSKQSRRRWFETPSRLLWRHCNGTSLITKAGSFRTLFHIQQFSRSYLYKYSPLIIGPNFDPLLIAGYIDYYNLTSTFLLLLQRQRACLLPNIRLGLRFYAWWKGLTVPNTGALLRLHIC